MHHCKCAGYNAAETGGHSNFSQLSVCDGESERWAGYLAIDFS